MALHKCTECQKSFLDIKTLRSHERTHASGSSSRQARGSIKKVRSAFKTRVMTLSYENMSEECLIPEVILKDADQAFKGEVSYFLKNNQALKYNIELHGLYAKPNLNDLENTPLEIKTFQTKMVEVFKIDDFERTYRENIYDILKKTEEFQERDSGWTLVQIMKVELNLNKYQPLKGSSFINLPRKLILKRACVNVQNSDIYCFKWAIISAIANINKNAQLTSKYRVNINANIINISGFSLDFSGLSFPLKIKDIKKFEDQNPEISINVFGYDIKEDLVVGPYHKTKSAKTQHINLIFLQDITGDNSHYVWIKNMSR